MPANAYLTPPGSQGFAVHSDTHDVFVFQTAGSKQWEVHTPDGVEQVLLEPGVSMYLPTGTPRRPRAGHGLPARDPRHQPADVARARRAQPRAGPAQAARHPPARRLPRPPRDPGRRPRDPARAARRRGARPGRGGRRGGRGTPLPHQPGAPLAGGLNDVLAVGDLGDDTRLRRRPGHPCVVLDRGERVDVLLGDRSVDMPAWLRPALDIRVRRELRPADLAGTSTRRAGWCSAGASSGKGCRGRRVSAPRDCLRGVPARVTPDQGFRARPPACSATSRLAGTASTVRAFLLIENTGPWGVDALRDSRLSAGVGPALRSATAAAGVRC